MQNIKWTSSSGIAIGPILFVLAMLALLATVMTSGFGEFGTASVSDRISADTVSQANLIISKINECNIKYGTNNNFDGYPSSDTDEGTLVSQLNCEGDPPGLQNLWTGQRSTTLPPPTYGFKPWRYINTNSAGLGGTAIGGRCIWTRPTAGNAASSKGVVDGLTKAANKFSNSPSFSSTSQVIYDPESASQKFIVWVTMPTGTPDENCLP